MGPFTSQFYNSLTWIKDSKNKRNPNYCFLENIYPIDKRVVY